MSRHGLIVRTVCAGIAMPSVASRTAAQDIARVYCGTHSAGGLAQVWQYDRRTHWVPRVPRDSHLFTEGQSPIIPVTRGTEEQSPIILVRNT